MRVPRISRVACAAGFVLALAVPAAQSPDEPPPDLAVYARIREEGTARSRVMEYASELMDEIGPRLTGSPNLERAMGWGVDRLRKTGAANARKESWGEFGLGWRQRNVSVRLLEPTIATFVAAAAPWSPATRGPVSAPVTSVTLADDRAFSQYTGRLRGKIVLLGRAPSLPEAPPIDKPLSERLTESQLKELLQPAPAAPDDSERLERAFADGEFAERIGRFFQDEGVRGVMVPSGNNPRGGASGGTLYADWNYNFGLRAHLKSHAMRVPLVVVAVEEYLRMKRLLDRGANVRVEMNVDVQVTGDRVEGFNVIGDIPGSDPQRAGEIVMMTAHLDSWAVGTGATDDGAGVVVALEAMRILSAIGARPRRTIRVALWTGEEQGMLGSTAYVTRHVATIPRATTPEQLRLPEAMRRVIAPVIPLGEHPRLSAVYNLDGGGGRIRGVAVGGNQSLIPIFEKWVAPLKDLGVDVVTIRPYCPGDCRPFAQAGIPTPGFIQDPLEYDTRTHHTNTDTYERLVADDVKQAAVVAATLLYNTAMRGDVLPRSAGR